MLTTLNVNLKDFIWSIFRNNFDDTEDAIGKRITIYNDKTKPVATSHKAKAIDAERSTDEIFADIQNILNGM